MNLQRLRINIFALAARLPTMLPQREYLDLGEISGWLRDVGFERVRTVEAPGLAPLLILATKPNR